MQPEPLLTPFSETSCISATSLVFCLFGWFWPHCASQGILVPQPRMEPRLPTVEGPVLTTGLPGKALNVTTTYVLLFLPGLLSPPGVLLSGYQALG